VTITKINKYPEGNSARRLNGGGWRISTNILCMANVNYMKEEGDESVASISVSASATGLKISAIKRIYPSISMQYNEEATVEIIVMAIGNQSARRMAICG